MLYSEREAVIRGLLPRLFFLFYFLFFFNCSPLLRESRHSSLGVKIPGVTCFSTYPDLCAQIILDDSPPHPSIEYEVKVFFWNKHWGSKEGPYLDPVQEYGITFGLFPWMVMESGTHGSTLDVIYYEILQEYGPGAYRVGPVLFTMEGTWQLKLSLLQNNQVIETVIEEIDVLD